MEQKDIVHKIFNPGMLTLERLLYAMTVITGETLSDWLKSKQQLTGETQLYQLLNSKDKTTSVSLDLKREVDLNKLKTYLKEQGLPFAFQKTETGVNLFFKVQNQELAKNALNRFYQAAISNAKEFSKMILKRPDQMSFEERIKYTQQKTYQGVIQGMEKVKVK